MPNKGNGFFQKLTREFERKLMRKLTDKELDLIKWLDERRKQ